MSGEPHRAVATSSPPPLSAEDEGPDPAIGTTLADKYELLAGLGEGGMGRVYLAEQTSLARRVAIKVLADHHAVPRAAERFFREAQATASIGHPNIIDILDFGRTDDGVVFIVMEYLEGEDLADTLARVGRMPWQRAAHIVIHVCRALGAAHDKGIVHRDVKPENIFRIERGRDRDFVKVLDFGIAKLVRPTPANQRLTRTGSVFGTPAYMSPEQARGREIDHRADIYSVGVILYELVTGRVPYDGEEFLDIAMQHLHEPVVGPGSVLPAGAVPAGLDAVVIQAMAKDREERFASMELMATALERMLAGDAGGTDLTPLREEVLSPVDSAAGAVATRANVSERSSVTQEHEPDLDVAPRSRGFAAVVAVAAVGVVGGVALVIASATGGTEDDAPTPVEAPAPASDAAEPAEAEPSPQPPPEDPPSVSPVPAPVEATPESPPTAKKRGRTLDNPQIGRAMRKLDARMSFCGGMVSGQDRANVKVSFVVEGATGRVRSAHASGGGTGVETCVRNVLLEAKFPTFGAKTQRIRWRVKVEP